MNKLKGIFLSLVLFFFVSEVFAQFAGGSGTQANPWQVETAEQLNNVHNYLGKTHSDKHFIQTADINLGVAPWNQGGGWVPIGTSIIGSNSTHFYGHYDGDGHVINNLYINRPSSDDQGLFGVMSGSLTNLGVEDVDVHGRNYIGGLVGRSTGSISNCYSTGTVSGQSTVGGLVGSSAGSISNCYSNGTVIGSYSSVGGLVGSTGNVSSITNSYYNYEDVLVNGNHILGIGALDNSLFNEWMANELNLEINDYLIYNGSSYLIDDISDFKKLLAFGQYDYSFMLTSDLDLNSYPGFYIPFFRGSFQGNGHTIGNLSLSVASRSNIGLFGIIKEANIANLSLTSVDISTDGYCDCIGSLVGHSNGSSINNCSVTDYNISSDGWAIGGLVARADSTTIANCNSIGSVSGGGLYNMAGSTTGGILGEATNSNITDCWSSGSVSGMIEVGGLIGRSYTSIISDCFSSVNVNGDFDTVGGLVGYAVSNAITSSYNTGNICGPEFVGGLVGTASGGTITSSYNTGSISSSGSAGGLVGSIERLVIQNSYYNYEDVLIDGSPVISVGALNDALFNTWLSNDLYLDIDDYLTRDVSDYLINNLDDFKKLLAFGQFGYSFKLTTHLDLSAESGLFIPYFSGNFHGNGYTISNLLIDQPSNNGLGMFGITRASSITNLGVVNATVNGSYNLGCLVGMADSTSMVCCYSTGAVNGSGGGLVGQANSSTISNCYSAATVTGNMHSGGLVGQAYSSTISNCYSTGMVSGTGWGVGGLVGAKSPTFPSSINNSYWNTETSGFSSSAGGEGRTTDEMTYPYAANTYMGWDFVNTWEGDTSLTVNSGYPFLQFLIAQIPNPAINPSPADLTAGISFDSALSWQADHEPSGDNTPTGFKLYLGTNNPPTNILNGVDLGYSLSYEQTLSWTENTLYYWQVVPYNRLGDAENCPVWSFSTYPAVPYAELSASQIQFGNVWIEHSATKSFTISNPGAQDLELTLFISSGAFTVTTTDRRIERSGQLGQRSTVSRMTREEINITVAPMTIETVYVHFLPTAQQQYSRNLFIETNAPNLPSATIPLTGTGYILFAEFQANPSTGDVPMEVSFVNQSVAGISQSLWDFGDGDTADEMNPTHTFAQEGVYNVQLTVWDDYFSTSATHPVTVIAHPMLSCEHLTGHVFNKTYTEEQSATFDIILQSSGTDTLYVTNVYWRSQQDTYFHYSFEHLDTAIFPGEIVTIPVHFAPLMEGVFADTLCIVNNSENQPLLLIPFSGRGYTLHAAFNYDPASGDVPLTVSFTDTSTEDIIQWAWDFGDGGNSALQNPVYVFETEGLHQVGLTVSDGIHFDTVVHPVQAIAHSMLACADTLTFNFGMEYLGDLSDSVTLTLLSTGTDTLYVNSISWQYGSPGFHYSYGDHTTPILPGSSASIDIWFQPTVQGAFSDSLIIETNAENLPVLKVKVMGRGEYVPPKAPENVCIDMEGFNAVISWGAVTQTIYNTPFTPDGYLVFYNGNPDPENDPYYFLAVTTDLSHTHLRVGEFAQYMFYRVIAYRYYGRDGFDISSLHLKPGMPEEEVLNLLLSW